MESCRNIVSKFLFALCCSPMKEALAEFIGTFFLVLCGDGVMASITLGRLGLNATLVAAFGWGLSLALGIWISGHISGGHLNPAVTTALATVRKCSWKIIAPYLVAQYLAGFLAAAVVCLVYRDGIADFDNGVRQLPPSVNSTAQIFSTYPQDSASIGSLFVDQVVGTCLLLIVICTATDARMDRSVSHFQPLIIGLGLVVIALSFGHNCGAPLNPARDLSPRLFTAIAGWGFATFSFRSYKWFWIPIVGPHVGALLGVWLYDFFIDMPFRKYALLEDVANHERDEEDRLPKLATMDSKPSMRPVLERSLPSSDYTGKSLLERSHEGDRTSSHEVKLNDGFLANKTSDL